MQDLAVVVLLMLIPLLAPAENGAQAAGFSKIAKALGVAAVKVCISEREQGDCRFMSLEYNILLRFHY